VVLIVWIDRVCSVARQVANTAASTTAYSSEDTVYATPSPTWSTSAAMVPNTPTMATASQ